MTETTPEPLPMDDFALAVRCYELGAVWFDETEGIYWTMRADGHAGEHLGSAQFAVRDGRVAAALMKKCKRVEIRDISERAAATEKWYAHAYAGLRYTGVMKRTEDMVGDSWNDDQCRAIIEATATALTVDHDGPEPT